jgi:hypothetical protein
MKKPPKKNEKSIHHREHREHRGNIWQKTATQNTDKQLCRTENSPNPN